MGVLEGKVAIVTGGNSGIGLAIAKRFVEEGAYVFITARRRSELDKAVEAIGSDVAAIAGDLSNLEEISRIAESVKRAKGVVDTTLALILIPEEEPLGYLRPIRRPNQIPVGEAPTLSLLPLSRLFLIPSRDHDGIVSHWLSNAHYLIAKWVKASVFETITVEHVVCVKRDEAFAVRVGKLDTGLLDRPEIEGLGVDELDDENAEEIPKCQSCRLVLHPQSKPKQTSGSLR